MTRYRFAVEYLGGEFCGWQSQPSGNSVQQELEKAFTTCLRQVIHIVGAGRTDAGVHAEGQVCHFDCEDEFDCMKIEWSVNCLTPATIAIRRLEMCQKKFHARYHALSRSYVYTISTRPTALHSNQVWTVREFLDMDLLESELALIRGTHDFSAFSISRKDGKSTDCTILKSYSSSHQGKICIHLEANRFLHKMVRSLVGACYDVSRKHHAPGLINAIFSKEFEGERTWAPPYGLCLKKVRYLDYEY